jgi:very-short-patch-repair endonuclease
MEIFERSEKTHVSEITITVYGEEYKLRRTIIDDQMWYRANDIGSMLKISNVRTNLQNMPIRMQCKIYGNGSQKATFLSKEGLLDLLSKSRSINTLEIANQLHLNINAYIPSCGERDSILKITQAFFGEIMHTQFKVLNYRLDLYFPKYNLAIEFDEKFHAHQVVADQHRESKIRKEIGCTFIRFCLSDNMQGVINMIFKHIIDFYKKNDKHQHKEIINNIVQMVSKCTNTQMLTLRFASGEVVMTKIAESLDELRIGKHLSKYVLSGETVDINTIESSEDAEPLLKFLQIGKYSRELIGETVDSTIESAEPFLKFMQIARHSRDTSLVENETLCYKSLHDNIKVPGLLSDIEDSIYKGVVSGIESIDDVEARFTGYATICAICRILRSLLPEIPITMNKLNEHLMNECGLVVFHSDRLVTLVFDLNTCTRITGGYYSLIDDKVITYANNKSNNRFVSFTGERLKKVASLRHLDELNTCCRNTRHGMKQCNDDCQDEPVFPPLHTIEAVLSMCDITYLNCLFTRDVYSDDSLESEFYNST